jgi:drug/metabolite transporter (DMT)-like permease
MIDFAMSKRTRIFLAFTSVYVLWGSTFVAIRYVAQLLHPAVISGLRYVLAGAIAMGYLLLCRRSILLPRSQWWRVVALGLLMFTVNATLVSYGGKILSAGVTALFISSIPIFIVLLDRMAGRTSMNWVGWLGSLTGLAGIALLASRSIRGQSVKSETVVASIALIVASIAWAIGSIFSRRTNPGVSTLVSSAWQMLIAGLINLSIGAACGGLRSSRWTAGAWLAMIYLSVFGSLAGYTSYVFLLRNVRLSSVATYAYINPIVAVLLGWVLLHERLHGVEWVGMGIVLVSVAVVIASKSPDSIEGAL